MSQSQFPDIYSGVKSGFITKTDSNTSYEDYFSACDPSRCTYFVPERRNGLAILIIVFGLIGGIVSGLKMLVPILFSPCEPKDEEEERSSAKKEQRGEEKETNRVGSFIGKGISPEANREYITQIQRTLASLQNQMASSSSNPPEVSSSIGKNSEGSNLAKSRQKERKAQSSNGGKFFFGGRKKTREMSVEEHDEDKSPKVPKGMEISIFGYTAVQKLP